MTSPVTIWALAAFAVMFVPVEPANLTEPICDLPKYGGVCKAYLPRYYYNSQVRECQRFIYGGCGGNANRFQDIETCRTTCLPANQAGRLSPGGAVMLAVLGFVATIWRNIY